MRKFEELALYAGEPAKKTPFGGGPKHSLAEWRAIRPIFKRGTIHMARGPEVMALRERFTKLFGMKYAVTASSGTAALHAATGALGIGRGDEVITSPITDMGTLTAILAQNAVPIFADVDPRTLMMTPETVAARITRRTKAIIVVHLAGLPADVRGIVRLARPRRIPVIEDMAQSYLCRQGRRYCGTFGTMSCWSLNESKHIGAGDGGVVLTNDKDLARMADLFADKGYDREGGPVDPFFAAYNYRLNTLVAAVCLEQMKKLHWICSRRHSYGARLDRELAKIEGIAPRPVRKGDYATYWYYVFLIDPDLLGCTNADFALALRAEGIGARAAAESVLDWTLFRERRPNRPASAGPSAGRHACADSCPLYRGKAPDYDIAHYPGLLEVKQRAVRIAMSEFWTPQDIRDVIRGVKKVARYYRLARLARWPACRTGRQARLARH
jgi:dTDP-4-amino-4,6-dideoxygalactose transaminase